MRPFRSRRRPQAQRAGPGAGADHPVRPAQCWAEGPAVTLALRSFIFSESPSGPGKSWERAALEPLDLLITSLLTVAQMSQAPDVASSAEGRRMFRGS